MIRRALVVAAALLELAQTAPPAALVDQGVLKIAYAPDRIVPLRVALGYALVVELSPEDRIETVVVGNGAAWQVTASKRGDQLVVKPLSADVRTDLIVTTAERRYVFLLEPGGSGDIGPFVVRFSYADVGAPAPAPKIAATYRLSGNRLLRPASMTDDGTRTRILWPDSAPMPAVFAVDDGGAEALVNGRIVDGGYVIQRIASRFVFRRGRDTANAVRRPLPAQP